MLNKVCEGKIDETVKKVVETRYTNDNSDSNTACIGLKCGSFASTMDQVIQSSL